MRFKKLLIENQNKEKFIEDCSTYINKNREKLENELSLRRGTFNEYENDVVKKSFRKREGVSGSPIYTYYYEKMRPSNIPSREDMIPCEYSRKISRRWKGGRNIYHVFPIGSNYKVVYTEGVLDFNTDNPFFTIGFAHPQMFLEDVKMILDRNDKLYQEIKNFLEDTRSRGYNEIMRDYDDLFNYIRDNKQKFEDILSSENANTVMKKYGDGYEIEEWFDKVKRTKKVMKDFFDKTYATKELPDDKDLEVNLYAPNGFYYVEPSIFDNLFR